MKPNKIVNMTLVLEAMGHWDYAELSLAAKWH